MTAVRDRFGLLPLPEQNASDWRRSAAPNRRFGHLRWMFGADYLCDATDLNIESSNRDRSATSDPSTRSRYPIVGAYNALISRQFVLGC